MTDKKTLHAPAEAGGGHKLRHALRAVVFGHLRVKRGDKGLKITWGDSLLGEDKPVPASERPDESGVSEAERRRHVMLAELESALDARVNNRKALPHLAQFEVLFARAGMDAFARVPLWLLRKAHQQLQLLSTGHAQVANGVLLVAMTEVLARRAATEAPGDDVLADPLARQQVVVSEGRMSDFMEAAGVPYDGDD